MQHQGQERVLIVDDDQAVRSSLRRYLQRHGFDVEEADSCESAEARFRTFEPDVALIDYRLPDGEALALLPRLRHIDPMCTLFVLTGYGTIDLAVRAVKEGATEFLTKPVDMPTLLRAVQIGVHSSRGGAGARGVIEPLFGTNRRMQDLRARVEALRDGSTPVLFVGEEGTGRNLLARWVHVGSSNATGPFVELDCESPNAERELFGFETPDGTARPGVLEAAERGVLYLEALDRASLALQAKLVQLLRQGTFTRVGSTELRESHARVIAASTVDLLDLDLSEGFDDDLRTILRSCTVIVPPLRDRRDEIPGLARHLLSRIASRHGRGPAELSTEAESELAMHSWPGNVRELENVLESALLLTANDRLAASDLPIDRASASGGVTLEEMERRTILAALREEQGRVGAAALRLGIPRSTLYYKLKTLGIAGRGGERRPRTPPPEN